MATLASITRYLDSLLQTALFKDSALNGLQVESAKVEVRRVALAVDAGASIIDQAVQADADLLLVHHGLFWGRTEPIAGVFGAKIRKLLQGKCSLYAAHLPLDAHAEVGNNFELARFFGLSTLEPFFKYEGVPIGVRGRTAGSPNLEWFAARARELTGARGVSTLPFGKPRIETVGIVSGSAAAALSEAVTAGCDLFVTGEPKQDMYHAAKELGVHVLFAGHYASETLGVQALGKRLKRDFEVSTVFIDEPTGI
jgi:dinuclear metal center YbgI/SA1388 family protein